MADNVVIIAWFSFALVQLHRLAKGRRIIDFRSNQRQAFKSNIKLAN